MNITGQFSSPPRVLEPTEIRRASSQADKPSGISVNISVHIDRATINDTLEKIPGVVAKTAPALGKATAEVMSTMSDKAQEHLAKGAAAAMARVSASVGQATDKVIGTAVNTVTAPVRGVRSAARMGAEVARFGAGVLLGR